MIIMAQSNTKVYTVLMLNRRLIKKGLDKFGVKSLTRLRQISEIDTA